MDESPRPPARWVRWLPAGYLAFGLCWVLGSDELLRYVALGDIGRFAFGSATKGVVFVVLTTALLQLALHLGLDPLGRPAHADEQVQSPNAAPVVAFLAAFLLILVCAYAIAEREIEDIRAQAVGDLRAMAMLKASQIESWYQSNVGIVESLALSHDVVLDVDGVQQARTSASRTISERVHGLRGSDDISAFQVFDADGREIDRTGAPVSNRPTTEAALAVALREGRTSVTDLYVDPRTNQLLMQVAAPLLIPRVRGAQVVGALLVTIDARDLLTGLGGQPIGDQPIETVLVHKDGATVHYVTARVTRNGLAAVRQMRPTSAELAAARVLDGESAPFEATSYRGTPVLAAGAAVPGTPWHVAVMLETAFVDARITGLLAQVAGLVLVSIATVVTLAMLWWHAERRRGRAVVAQVAERAEAAESRLGWLSDHANDAILLIADDGHVVDANQSALRFYGYSREELLGMRTGDLRTPEDRASGRYATQFAQALGQGQIVFETTHVRKDGSRFPVEVSAGRVEHGGHKLVQSIIRDITERKAQQAALADSERRYRTLFDAVPYPMCVHDVITLEVLLVNAAAVREYGWSREELARLTLVDLTAPTQRHRIARHAPELAGSDRSVTGLWRALRKDGSEFDAEIASRPFALDGRDTRIVVASNVSERVAAQQALAASEARYRLLFHANPLPMWVFDVETLRILMVNVAAVSHYGYSESEFLSMTIEQIRPPEDVERLRQHVSGAPGSKIRRDGLWKHRRKDGTLIDVEVTSHAIRYEDRDARLVLANDVTRRLEAEHELRVSENRYRTLFDQIPDGVAHADTEGRLVAANEAWLRMLGYVQEDVGTLRIDDVLAPIEAPRFADMLRAAAAGEEQGVSNRRPWRHRRRDGSEFVAEVSSRLLVDGSTLGVVRDLTDTLAAQHRIEVQRDMFELLTLGNQAMARATTRDELFRSVVELIVSRAGYRLAWFGEIAGDSVVPVAEYGDDDGHLDDARASIRSGQSPSGGELVRMLRTGMITAIQDTLEYPNLLISEELGRQRGIRSVAIVPIRARGVITHGLLVYADRANGFEPEVLSAFEDMGGDVAFALDLLTTREELAEAHAGLEQKVEERTRALAEARDRAEAADRAKSVFLSSVSHELRSPLHSILGFASVLSEQIDGPLNVAQLEHLQIVREAGQNLLGLINDLIDVSKLEAGLMALEHRPFPPADSIRRVIGRWRTVAEDRGLELLATCPGDVPPVEGDVMRYEQVLDKLLSNALLYTERGSVTVSCASTGTEFRVSVADTGRGISPNDLPTLFQRFNQLDPGHGRLRRGTGLGLAIAYGLARAMGGTLGCDSEVGRGSTFTLAIPLSGLPIPTAQP